VPPESVFSGVAAINGKHRSKVNMERQIRLGLSKMKPRFQELYSGYRTVVRDLLGGAQLKEKVAFFNFPLAWHFS
jgi:hypothetical protein